jgi:hypothetical protein
VVWLWVLVAVLALAFFGRDALASWMSRSAPRAGAPRRTPAAESRPAMSAAWLLVECARLGSTGASWNDVAAALNPDNDSQVESVLGRLRAAHDGAVPAILNAIEDGCRAALADNGDASAYDALSLAARNNQWRSTARW